MQESFELGGTPSTCRDALKGSSVPRQRLASSELAGESHPEGWRSSQIASLRGISRAPKKAPVPPTRIAQPISVAEATFSHCSADPVHSSRQIGPAISHHPTSAKVRPKQRATAISANR